MKRRYDSSSRLAAAELNRRRIVQATVELHAENGAMGSTHEMIARRAGVSLPTVYKYFPTRNDLIPHCTGAVMAAGPPPVTRAELEAFAAAPARLRALTERTFAFYAHAAPWLRWSARDAAELPALRELLERTARERVALVRVALAPRFPAAPPRACVALACALLDFPTWQTLTGAGSSAADAVDVVADALVTLVESAARRPGRATRSTRTNRKETPR